MDLKLPKWNEEGKYYQLQPTNDINLKQYVGESFIFFKDDMYYYVMCKRNSRFVPLSIDKHKFKVLDGEVRIKSNITEAISVFKKED